MEVFEGSQERVAGGRRRNTWRISDRPSRSYRPAVIKPCSNPLSKGIPSALLVPGSAGADTFAFSQLL